jgi:hypothetical protein
MDESPTIALRRDLELVTPTDRLESASERNRPRGPKRPGDD